LVEKTPRFYDEPALSPQFDRRDVAFLPSPNARLGRLTA